MYKKMRKLFAVALTLTMLLTMLVFPAIASAETPTGIRLSGKDRYETALKIVQAGWTSSDSAVIARGDDLADALSAAPLAYAKGKAPILLTSSNKLPAGVLDELKKLGVKNVYIVGGEGAVSKAVETELKKVAAVERVYGSDRAATSLAVAKKVSADPSDVVLANGLSYSDALSVSPIAAANGMPILLVVGNKLTAEQASYIAKKTVYAVGGSGVLSDAVVKGAKATRLGGANRYETNAAILTEFEPDFSKFYIAKGTDKNLVDALAGSALAALGNNPIILVDGDSKLDAKIADVLLNNATVDSTEVVLGGTVAQSVIDSFEELRKEALAAGAAIEAVEKAEETKLQADVDAAKALVDKLPEDVAPFTLKADLESRLEAITMPVISDIKISSNNADNTKAMNGDTITLTFTSNVPVSKLSNFKINGSNPDTFTNVGNVYTVKHLVDSGDLVTGEPVTFQINVKNAAGIYSQTIEKTTDGSSVTIIGKMPRITDVKITSNSANGTSAAKIGDTIFLIFQSDEPVTKSSNFKINGSNPDTFTNVGNLYIATHIVDSGDLVTGEPATFQINVKNAAGIYSQTIEETTDGTSVTIVK